MQTLTNRSKIRNLVLLTERSTDVEQPKSGSKIRKITVLRKKRIDPVVQEDLHPSRISIETRESTVAAVSKRVLEPQTQHPKPKLNLIRANFKEIWPSSTSSRSIQTPKRISYNPKSGEISLRKVSVATCTTTDQREILQGQNFERQRTRQYGNEFRNSSTLADEIKESTSAVKLMFQRGVSDTPSQLSSMHRHNSSAICPGFFHTRQVSTQDSQSLLNLKNQLGVSNNSNALKKREVLMGLRQTQVLLAESSSAAKFRTKVSKIMVISQDSRKPETLAARKANGKIFLVNGSKRPDTAQITNDEPERMALQPENRNFTTEVLGFESDATYSEDDDSLRDYIVEQKDSKKAYA